MGDYMEEIKSKGDANYRVKRKPKGYQEPYNNISYKVNTTDTYIVFKKYINGKPFYMIGVSKKCYDKRIWGYKVVRFNNGIELEDRSVIKIIKGFEDFYYKKQPNGVRKTEFPLHIEEFELYDTPESLKNRATKEYIEEKEKLDFFK